jgi:hypothetical protein
VYRERMAVHQAMMGMVQKVSTRSVVDFNDYFRFLNEVKIFV